MKLMRWATLLVALSACCVAHGQTATGEIKAAANRYILALDADVAKWTVDPPAGCTVTPTGTRTATAEILTPGSYWVTARLANGTGRAILLGSGDTPQPPVPTDPTATITADPTTIEKGKSSVLKWSSSNAATAKLNDVNVELIGVQAVVPDKTTTYTLIVSSADGKTAKATATVTVTDAPQPGDIKLSVIPDSSTIKLGGVATLAIVCSEMKVTIDNGVGAVALSTELPDKSGYLGFKAVSPKATTKYTATATKGTNTKSVTFTITVSDSPTPPDPPNPNVPIKTTGLHILIQEETANRINVPLNQFLVMFGRAPGTARDYAFRKCAANPDGTPAIAVIDQHLTPRSNDPFFAAAKARLESGGAALPRWYAGNETAFIEGPLPVDNATAVAALVAKFGAAPAAKGPPLPQFVRGPPARVIDDTNFKDIMQPPQGESKGYRPRAEHPRFAKVGSIPGVKAFGETMPVIPRSQWPARIKAMDDAWAWPEDWMDWKGQEKDQRQTNFCWANAPTHALDIVRHMQGLIHNETSAASVACPITGFSNVGGWGLDAVEYLAKTGGASVNQWPNAAINRAYDTSAVKAFRPNRIAVEWLDMEADNTDQLGTAILLGYPCPLGLGWWSHEITVVRLVQVSSGTYGWNIANSWGQWGSQNRWGLYGFEVLSESKSRGDSQCLRAVTDSPVVPASSPVEPSSFWRHRAGLDALVSQN